MSEKKVGRRSFVKYAAAGVVAVAVAGAGAYYYATMPKPTITPTPTLTQAQTLTGALTTTPKAEPIKIGGLYPLTGAVAFDGQDEQYGAQMAIDEINATGGVLGHPLEHLPMDTGYYIPDKAVGCIEKLATVDKVHLFVAAYMSQTGWELDTFEKYAIPNLNGDGGMGFMTKCNATPDKYWSSWMMAGPVCYNGVRFPALLEEIINSGGWKPANRNVAYITLDNEYSRYVDESFRGNMKEGEVFGLTIPGFPKFGWKEVMHEVAEIGSVEWRPLISKIKKANPALLVFTDFVTSDEISFLRQFIPSPTNTLIYMAYGPQMPEFIMQGSDVANGIIHSTDVGQIPDENGLAWEQKFKAKFGRLPGLAVAANLYDEVYLWKAAVEKAGTYEDHAAVAAEISKIKYKGITGTAVFDPKTHTVEYATEKFPDCNPFMYYQIQDLNQVCVDPKQVAKPFILPPWIKK